jgi:hypothetical protein
MRASSWNLPFVFAFVATRSHQGHLEHAQLAVAPAALAAIPGAAAGSKLAASKLQYLGAAAAAHVPSFAALPP